MEAIRLSEYVTDKGLIIENKKLKGLQNMMVEIIILPIEEKTQEKKFMSFSGMLNEEEGNKMLNDINDCRKIDQEDWI